MKQSSHYYSIPCFNRKNETKKAKFRDNRFSWHKFVKLTETIVKWRLLRQPFVVDSERVIGVHLNYLPTVPSGDLNDLSVEDKARVAQLEHYLAKPAGYMRTQSTRPQTLAYVLTDSPVGQLAWIAEKFIEWIDPARPVEVDRLLTNVMFYWLTGQPARQLVSTTSPHCHGANRCRVPCRWGGRLPARPCPAGTPSRRAQVHDRTLVRVRPWRPLRSVGGARTANRRSTDFLPPFPFNYVIISN
jgi:hypothetical protein